MDPEPIEAEAEEVQEPENEEVRVVCGGCRAEYTFDVAPEVQSFPIYCQHCGSKSTWYRD